jgi:hypothetical protein
VTEAIITANIGARNVMYAHGERILLSFYAKDGDSSRFFGFAFSVGSVYGGLGRK